MRKYIPYITILVLLVLLFASMQTCSFHKSHADSNLEAITDTVKHFKNRLGTQTASINTLQLDKKQLQDLILDKDAELAILTKEFSKVNTITKYKTVTHIDTIRIAYKDTVPCVFDRTGEVKDTWYSFSYKSNQKGIQVDSLTIPNTTTAITGFKRDWIFGKQTIVTDITNSNPLIRVTEMKSVEIVVPVPWYEKWYTWLAAGLIGGFIIK